MSANATASLTIKLAVQGAEQLKGLTKELGGLAASARKAASGGGLEKLSSTVSKVGIDADKAAFRMHGALDKITGDSARSAAKQEKWADSLQLRLNKFARSTAAEAEKAAARRAAAAERAAKAELRGVRTVEGEMTRLQRLASNRAITAEARERLGMGPSVLTGHGFLSRPRQVLGLMRDITVAGMGIRYAIGAAAGIGHAVFSPFMEFEQSLANVQAKGGYTADAMAKLSAKMKEMGNTSIFGARASAEASVELAAAGLSAEDQMKSLPSVLKLATAAQMDTTSSAHALIETMAQFGYHASDFEHIGDVLVKSANVSTVSVQDMTEALKYVGPIASKAGVGLEETAAMISLLGENGIKGSMGGTALRGMLVAMIHPVKTAKKAMQELHLTTADMQKGITNIPAFFDLLNKRMSARKLNTAQRLEMERMLFGVEAMAGVEAIQSSMAQVDSKGRSVFQRYADYAKNADGEMQQNADKLSNTFTGKMQRMRAAIETAQIELGTKLAPTVSDLIPKMTSAAVSVGQWVGNNTDFVASMATVIPSIGGLTFAVNGAVTAIAAIMKANGEFGSAGGLAGTSFGTTFALAAVTAITAYGITSHLLKETGLQQDITNLGAKIYEWLNGSSDRNLRGKNGEVLGANAAAPGKADPTERLAESIADAIRRGKRDAAASAGETITDPILQHMAEAGRGVPAALAQRAPWNGKLEIEITRDGRPVVGRLHTTGDDLAVGVNVQP